MAQYTNPKKGSQVTINHKGGHIRLSYGDVKEIPSDVDVSKLVARGVIKPVDEAPAPAPAPRRKSKQEEAPEAEPTTDNQSQS